MGHVDLRRRKRDRARSRRTPTDPWHSLAHNPYVFLGAGFLLGALFPAALRYAFYPIDSFLLSLAVATILVVLACYAGWLLLRGDTRPARSEAGSEKQLLLAILDAGGSITPVEAALETSLAVDEAEEILTRFADRGHLVVEGRDGTLFYSLPGRPSPEGTD